MNGRVRWSVAALTVLTLIGLVVWQRTRHSAVARCVAAGGVWNGPTSRCVQPPGPPILMRDLRRS